MKNIVGDLFKVSYAVRPVKVKKFKRLPCKVYSKEEIELLNNRFLKEESAQENTDRLFNEAFDFVKNNF